MIRITLRKENMEQSNFKKPFEFQNFSEIFYCSMNRLRNTNLSVFMQCLYRKTILRNKNMGKSLLKKHSKFRTFDEIFYCGMIRLKNTDLDVFIPCQYTRTILRKRNMGQSNIQNFNIQESFLGWHRQMGAQVIGSI